MEDTFQDRNYIKKHSTKYFHQMHSNSNQWNQLL